MRRRSLWWRRRLLRLAQILSELLNSIFLDFLEQDVDRLEHTNELLGKIAPEERGDLRPVEILVLRPSEDLAALAATYEPRLPRAFRYLMRSLGTREPANPDFIWADWGNKDSQDVLAAVDRAVAMGAAAPITWASAAGATAASSPGRRRIAGAETLEPARHRPGLGKPGRSENAADGGGVQRRIRSQRRGGSRPSSAPAG